MPVLRDVSLTLVREQVLRRQGMGKDLMPRAEMAALSQELLASVGDLHLLEPAIAYELCPVTEIRHDRVCLESGTVLQGQLLPSLLSTAKELAAVVCTIGPRLEEKVAYHFSKKEPLRGLLLDGIGSAAVDSLIQEVCKFMAGEASARGYQASSPINPGMPGLPITEQWQLLKMVPAREIGVSLTSSGIMVPRKSTAMVIGIGPKMTTWTRAEVCVYCSLRETCSYRIYT